MLFDLLLYLHEFLFPLSYCSVGGMYEYINCLVCTNAYFIYLFICVQEGHAAFLWTSCKLVENDLHNILL